jgi:hypothetical protein
VITTEAGQQAYEKIGGLAPKQAQRKIVEMLTESGQMLACAITTGEVL